jgi:diguanylate cyclase (GGDEF)-like protein/PAS domain S-box-containing protein
MAALLKKGMIGVAAAVATLLALVVVIEAEQAAPLPAVADLARQFWAGMPVAPALSGQALQQGEFYLFVLMHQWLLWLIPLAGAAMAWLLMRGAGGEETTVYLERIHSQEKALDALKQTEHGAVKNWEAASGALDHLLEKAGEMWLVVGREGRILRGNAAALEFLRRENPGLEQMAGQDLRQLVGWLMNSPLYAGLTEAWQGKAWTGTVVLPDNVTHLLAWVWPWGGDLAVLLRDVSAQYRPEALVQTAGALARQLVEESPRPLGVLDNDGCYVYVSHGMAEALGLPERTVLRGQAHERVAPDFPPGFRAALQQAQAGAMVGREDERRTVNGREEVWGWNLRAWRDAGGRPAGTVLSLTNHSELARLRAQVKEADERENTLAYSDALTGLPNRQLFHDRLTMALAVAHRQLGKLALLFLDLDGFKAINDTLGHDYGDLLLKQVAERIKTCVRQTDTVARLGGDEFTIILGIRGRDDAEQVAKKLLAAIREPYDLAGKEGRVGTSIGIALYPGDGQQAGDLMRKADNAMYEAKQAGKNTYRFASKVIKVIG